MEGYEPQKFLTPKEYAQRLQSLRESVASDVPTLNVWHVPAPCAPVPAAWLSPESR